MITCAMCDDELPFAEQLHHQKQRYIYQYSAQNRDQINRHSVSFFSDAIICRRKKIILLGGP